MRPGMQTSGQETDEEGCEEVEGLIRSFDRRPGAWWGADVLPRLVGDAKLASDGPSGAVVLGPSMPVWVRYVRPLIVQSC